MRLSNLDKLTAASQSTWRDHWYFQANQLRSDGHYRYYNEWSNQELGSTGPGGTGTITVKSLAETATYGWNTVGGNWGDRDGHRTDPPPLVTTWGDAVAGPTWADAAWNEFVNSTVVQWLGTNASQLLQIGGGVADVIGGALMTLGTCGARSSRAWG